MERLLAERSILRYTNPLRIQDKYGNELPYDQRVPSEISSILKRDEDVEAMSKKLQSILNCVLPPREWEEDGEMWMQQVSPKPVTRADVINLRVLFDQKLKSVEALDSGIDPVRRHIYGMLMDELIRQEVIMNPDRGIILLKIRDELQLTLDVSQALFENGKLYGVHKAAEAEMLRDSLVVRYNRHLKERDTILAELNVYRAKYKAAKKRSIESLIRFDNICLEELNNLNDVTTSLKV